MRKIVEVVQSYRLEADSRSIASRQFIQFSRPCEKSYKPNHKDTSRLLSPGKVWHMAVDFRKHLQFPREILKTSLRPGLVMWYTACKMVLLVELMVPW